MKHRILTVVSAAVMAFGLTCCDNPEVEVWKSIEIKLRPSTILSGFTPYQSSDFEMFSYSNGDSHLRITCLLYDGTGKLAYKNEALLDDYNSDISFTAMLDAGSYRLIALATNIIGALSSPTNEAYTITGTEQLDQLQIQQVFDISLGSTWSIMGYATRDVSNSEKEIVVNMEPATSLVYLQWKNIHAHDNDDSTSDIYGQYTATATDYWEKNTYTWPITIEKDGSSTTDVIVKDFSPALYKYGWTAEEGYNTYKGKISGKTLTIPKGQSTGYKDDDGDVLLLGMSDNGDYEDIVLEIGNGELHHEIRSLLYTSGRYSRGHSRVHSATHTRRLHRAVRQMAAEGLYLPCDFLPMRIGDIRPARFLRRHRSGFQERCARKRVQLS